MIAVFLNILLFFFGIISVLTKKVNYFLFTLIYFCTSFFGLIPKFINYGFRDINNSDLAILLLLLGIFFLPKKNNMLSRISFYYSFTKIINYFLILVIGLIFYDILFEGNSLSNIFIESRIYLFLLTIKLIDRVDLKNTYRLINFIAIIISIKSIIYVFQYIFSVEIFETTEFLLSINKYSGFSNFSPLIIIYLLSKSKKTIIDILFIIFLFLSSICLGSSGYILINFITIFCFFYYQKKSLISKFILIYFIPAIVFILIFSNQAILSSNMSNEVYDDYNESSSFISNYTSSYDISEFYHGGSLQFRLAMLAERVFYLIDNNKLFFGNGFTPDSKLDSQIFILGTHTDNYSFGIEQFNSADILYVNLISRFGLIGSLFFIYIFIYFHKLKSFDQFFFISLLVYLMISSLNSNLLYQMNNFILIFLLTFSIVEYKLKYFHFNEN